MPRARSARIHPVVVIGRCCGFTVGVALLALLVGATLDLRALAAQELAAQEPGTLRVGAIRYKSEEAFRNTFEPLVAYLAAELDLQPELALVDEEPLAYRLAAGEFDLGVFTPFPYLKAKLEFPELEVFASHLVRGGETYRGALIVRADSAIETLDDLKGKSLLFVKPTSTSGFKLPDGILRENGLHFSGEEGEEGEEGGHEFSGGHEASVRRLLAGEVDGVAVDLDALAALSPAEKASLRVLEQYNVPYPAYVFSPHLEPATRRRIMDTMFEAHRNPDTAPLWVNPLDIERWVARADTFYNPVRRYLGMVRSKPQLAVSLVMKASARRALESDGDFIEVFTDTIRNELRRTRRFGVRPQGSAEGAGQVTVDLAQVGDSFHCQSYLDGEWLRSIDLTRADLLAILPQQLARDVLGASPLESPLLFNGERWFITHGLNDGIDLGSYDFSFQSPSGERVTLTAASVEATTPLNTFLRPNEQFSRGMPITLTYRAPEGVEVASQRLVAGEGGQIITHGHAEASQLRGFWGNLDNRWGVISLVIASLSLALGGYLRASKQRRFRTVLNESLDLLRVYLEGKYDLQARMAEQREKILHYLEKNYINENQYLILKHHLDEVETVIAQLASQDVADTQEVQAELRQIVRDGKITAEELEHLAATLREATGEEEPVS